MGSEGEGIQPLIEKTLDFRLFISMRGVVSSLNVSQATALMLHALAVRSANLGDVKAS
jgi:tRNA G18 (ribose-2'-O)-methylase SpoU